MNFDEDIDFRAETVKMFFKTLPNSAEDIRNLLREKGIKGNRKSSSCPMAILIKLETGVSARVVKGSTYESEYEQRQQKRWDVANPEAMQRFIVNFDGHMYPELDAEEDE